VSALGQVIALKLRSAIPPDSLFADENTILEEVSGVSPLLSLHPEDQILCRVKAKGRAGKKCDGDGSTEVEFEAKELTELDYCQMINRFARTTSTPPILPSPPCRCLPNEIRVIGWTEVTPEFSARFSATSRTYRYFFLRCFFSPLL
jgi:hypothetical protein